MGIEVVRVGREGGEATMPVAGNTQTFGILHGGASAVLAETIGSLVAAANAPEGMVPVGVELSVSHHRAVRDGLVHAAATPVHIGRRMATVEISLTDGEDHRVASSRLTCYFRRLPSPN
jgi:uncharacterized protein (TIGR00369 family)